MRRGRGCAVSAADVGYKIAEIAAGAIAAGLAAHNAGKSQDEALMAMEEHVANERAKEKFLEYKEG